MDAGTLELVELDETIDHGTHCQSQYHASGVEGHSGSAEYLQIGICEHMTGFRCGGFVRYHIARQRGLKCGFCGIRAAQGETTWIPLPGVDS